MSALRKRANTYHDHEAERFTIVCAWCNRVQRGRDWRAERVVLNGPHVSHGICPDCFKRQIERLSAQK